MNRGALAESSHPAIIGDIKVRLIPKRGNFFYMFSKNGPSIKNVAHWCWTFFFSSGPGGQSDCSGTSHPAVNNAANMINFKKKKGKVWFACLFFGNNWAKI